jgi:hypothetical protein
MINGNNMYIQTAGMNIRKDNDDWRRAVDTVDAAEIAILTEKTITENGTYNPSDDSADGYSSVTVDVSGEPHFSKLTINIPLLNGSYMGCKILDSQSGEYNIDTDNDHTQFTLVTPAKKFTGMYLTPKILFTPSLDFDGFYDGGNKVEPTGDEIVAGDGKQYLAKCNRQYGTGPLSVAITKYSVDYVAQIE